MGPRNSLSTILYCRKSPLRDWTSPVVAPFSGKFGDLEPAFSPDGMKLYFSSNRPIDGSEPKDYDIWVVEKTNGRWSDPRTVAKHDQYEGQ